MTRRPILLVFAMNVVVLVLIVTLGLLGAPRPVLTILSLAGYAALMWTWR